MNERVHRSAEVAAPHFRNERSIEIAATSTEVWPWLAQMGFGRAGWYSWDLVDNLGRRSAEELHPEWMVCEPGDRVPGGPIDFTTPIVEPPHHLVLAFGPQHVGLWQVDFTLAYRLRATRSGTRLGTVAMGRIDGPLGPLAARWLLGPGDAFMVRKQLRGIRDRAELCASNGPCLVPPSVDGPRQG